MCNLFAKVKNILLRRGGGMWPPSPRNWGAIVWDWPSPTPAGRVSHFLSAPEDWCRPMLALPWPWGALHPSYYSPSAFPPRPLPGAGGPQWAFAKWIKTHVNPSLGRPPIHKGREAVFYTKNTWPWPTIQSRSKEEVRFYSVISERLFVCVLSRWLVDVAVNLKNRPREALCLKAFLIRRTSVLILESRGSRKAHTEEQCSTEWVRSLNF